MTATSFHIARPLSSILAAGLLGVAAIGALLLDVLALHAQENAFIGLVGLTLLGLGAWHRDRPFFWRRWVVLFLSVLLLVAMTTQAQSHTVQADIPRLRGVLRALLYGHILVLLVLTLRRASNQSITFCTLLWAFSFPYQSAYIYNPASLMVGASCTLALTMVGLPGDPHLQGPVRWAPAFLVLSLVPAALWSWDAPLSLPYLWLVLMSLFYWRLTRSLRASERENPLGWLQVFFAANLLYLAAATLFQAVQAPAGWLLARKTSFADINSNDAAAFVALFWPLLVVRTKTEARLSSLVARALFLVVAVLFVVCSGVRLAWLTVPATALLWLVASGRLRSPRAWFAILVLGIVLAGAGYVFVKQVTGRPPALLAISTLRMRYALWALSSALAAESPMTGSGALLYCATSGVGGVVGGSAGLLHLAGMARNHGGCFHAHNLLLQLLLDGGLLHLAALLLMGGWALARSWHSRTTTAGSGAVFAMLGGFIFQGLFNYHFVVPLYLFFLIGLGILLPEPQTPPEPQAVAGRRWRTFGAFAVRALALVLLLMHMTSLLLRERGLQQLEGMSFKNATGAWVFAGPWGAPEALREAQLSFERALWIFPNSAELHEMAGEAALGAERFPDARDHFSFCAERGSMKAHCLRRLSTIVDGDNAVLARRLLGQSRSIDPLGILDNGFLRRVR